MDNNIDYINLMCPTGIEFRPLLDVANVLYGFPCDASKFNESDGRPLARIRNVLDGVTDTYTQEEIPDKYTLIKGDLLVGMDGNFHVGKWQMDDGILCQRVCKFESNDNEETILNGWLSHILPPIMKNIENKKPSGTVKHLLDRDIQSIEIPVPPLPIQKKIVRILDTFTELEAELEAELEMRKKQYEYYRDKMCSFDESVPKMLLGELFTFKNGINKEKDCFGHGTPIINFTDVYNKNRLFSKDVLGLVEITDSETERFKVTKGDVFFTRTSETINEVGYSSVIVEDIDNCIFSGFLIKGHPTTELLLPEYCSYCFRTSDFRKNIVGKAHMTTRATITGEILKSIKISVPSLEVQKHIVDVLDKFNSLTMDISEGLPAEIKMRHQQYEYYRDKLLTFERL